MFSKYLHLTLLAISKQSYICTHHSKHFHSTFIEDNSKIPIDINRGRIFPSDIVFALNSAILMPSACLISTILHYF